MSSIEITNGIDGLNFMSLSVERVSKYDYNDTTTAATVDNGEYNFRNVNTETFSVGAYSHIQTGK